MSDNCFYTVTDNPKFYIKDEYGNLKEFGKFASADTDLITWGEGSNFFDEIKPLEFVPPEKLTNTIRIIKNDTETFNCSLYNVDLSFIWGNKKSIQIAELKYHLSMEAKNGNLLSNVVLEGLNRGLISVDDYVKDYLPGFEKNGKGEITIAQLLTHSSGLPQWEPTFLYCNNKEEQLEYLNNLELVESFKTDGSEPKYSDFSFMALGFIVESVSGQDMDVFAKENIYGPLGMTSTTYNPLENGFTKDQIAATSLGNPYEYRMVDEINYPGVGYDCTDDADAFAAFDGWRNYTLIGEVNDGNAAMGGQGVAGHAGLFSTAKDLAILLQTMLNGGEYNGVRLYSEETVELFTTKHTSYAEAHNGSLSEEFGYGFKLDQSWMGATATEAVYGHDGFTGTTVFVDPDNDYIFICLSNKMQAGFRTSTSNSYYNTNSWLSWNMNQAVKDALGI